jgi:hypothetical protein
MKQTRSILELQKQLNQLNEERNLSQKFNDDSKKLLCEEIKSVKPEEIKNTVFVEKKYTIWERMKRVLGFS